MGAQSPDVDIMSKLHTIGALGRGGNGASKANPCVFNPMSTEHKQTHIRELRSLN